MSLNKFTIKENIEALILVLNNCQNEKGFVHVNYVTEKLIRILDGTSNWHPLVSDAIKDRIKYRKQINKRVFKKSTIKESEKTDDSI